MSVEIPMPRLSQTTDEVKLIRWLVAVGDLVAKGQALCEVENDKTTMEVESFAAGTVLRLAGEPESMISAGTVIAVLGEAGERAAAAPAAAAVPGAGERAAAPAPKASPAAAPAPAAGAPGAAAAAKDVLATPLVRNLARKQGVDLSRVHGSGARGLITRADLEAYVPGAVPAAAAAREVPLSAHQRAVARAVTAAKTQVPHYYLKVRIGADRLRAWREANGRADGTKVAVDAVLAWACARALLRHPRLNGTFTGELLRLESRVHLGIAVAAGEELHVPVIHGAEGKSIHEIDRELSLLAGKAKAGGLAGAEVTGGSFTITNLGMYPVEEFAAVLNVPQLAIVAAGRMAQEIAVSDDGSFRVRSALTLTGSFDHRAINGAQGAAFLAEIKRILEEEL